jgi:hypothetical protein
MDSLNNATPQSYIPSSSGRPSQPLIPFPFPFVTPRPGHALRTVPLPLASQNENSNEVTPNLRGRKRGRPSGRGKSVAKGDERIAWSDEEVVSRVEARYELPAVVKQLERVLKVTNFFTI